VRGLDQDEQRRGERERLPRDEGQSQGVATTDGEQRDQRESRDRSGDPHVVGEREQRHQHDEDAGGAPEQRRVGGASGLGHLIRTEDRAPMQDREDRDRHQDPHERGRPAQRDERPGPFPHRGRGEQVREVRDREREGRGVGEPDGGQGERQRGDADALRQHDDDRCDDHGGRVEREEHGAHHGEHDHQRPQHHHAAATPAREALRDDVEHRRVTGELGDDRDRDDEPQHGRDPFPERTGVRARQEPREHAPERGHHEPGDDPRPRPDPHPSDPHLVSIGPAPPFESRTWLHRRRVWDQVRDSKAVSVSNPHASEGTGVGET
jgi:hypothetical protein